MKVHHARAHGESLTLKEWTCEECGDTFERHTTRNDGEPSYCSNECRYAGRRERIILNCDECGEEIERIPAKVSDTNFCSRECKHEYFNDPETDFWQSNDWKDWRDSVFERDNYTCQDCGTEGGDLNAHHVERRYESPDMETDVDNGVTLCVECHVKRHEEAGEEDAARLLRTKYDLAG